MSVEEVVPGKEIPRASNLTFVFSDDVVPDSLLGRRYTEQLVEFSPHVPGQFQWVAPNKLRFYPDVMLAPSTEYRLEVQPQAVAPYGLGLRGERTFVVQTPRLQVTSAYLTFEYSAETNRQARLVATVAFNSEVAPEDVAEHVSVLYEDGERIPFRVLATEPSTVVELVAEGVRRGEDERRIELYVPRGFRGVGGNLGLADAYVRPATLPGQHGLAVERVETSRESASEKVLRIFFTMPVRPDEAAEYLSLSPAVDVQVTGNHDYLIVRGAFATDQTYQLALRKGLVAVDGTRLGRDFMTSVTFHSEDIPPQLDFVGKGVYLTRSGHLNLGLSTINLDRVTIEIDQIFANNLVQVLNMYTLTEPESYYHWRAGLETIGRQVHTEDLVVPIRKNEEVVTPISVEQYLRGSRNGIFKVTARKTDQRWDNVSRWVVATDLGLIAKEAGNDLWVWVNSLTTLDPIGGAELTLFSQNNQVLATARTDGEGIAVFEDYTRFQDEHVPFVVTAALGDDLSFIELTRLRLETSDFDVGGLPYLQHGYEAFLYDERGVYRPGETAHLGIIVRGAGGTVPQPFPVRLRVTGPDGTLLVEQRRRLNDQGGSDFAVEIPDYALTGRYAATLLIGENEQIGQSSFSVEEFVPDRMKVRLETDKEAYAAGEAMELDVEGVTLFGPPASGRRVQATIEIEPQVFAPEGFASFTFGDPERTFTPVKADLEEQKLDADGRASFSYVIPQEMSPPSALRAVAEVTVLEPGGRGVTAYRAAVVHPYDTYPGVKARQEGYAEPGKAFPVSYVVLDTGGTPLADRTLQVSLYHVRWNSIWQRGSDGRYHYTSEEVEVLEHAREVVSSDEVGQFSVTPETYGRYRLKIEDPSSGASSVLSFYSGGWGYAPWAMDSPDRVKLELDKERYKPGETARILVQAPFPGKLLLTVERDRIFDHQVVSLEANTAMVALPISDAYKPNVYVSAHLIRSTDGLEREESARAFGMVPLLVDTESNRLEVELESPTEIRPNNPLTVNVEVRGGESPPFVTIAAVDEGITQLTDFQTPDPHGYFYGKKRLEVNTYDLYGVILPEVEHTLSSPAGDVEAARKRRVNPVAARRVKPVAFWSGTIETDRRGRGQVTFDIPQFNGTVRLMAVAYTGASFGRAETGVLVRDPIVMTPTFPRFISSGDETISVPVSLFNGTGRDAEFVIRLDASGPVMLQAAGERRIRIPAGREGQVAFEVGAEQAVGKATFRLVAEGGGQRTRDEVEVPVRPPVPFTTMAGSGALQPGDPTSFRLPDSFVPGTGAYELVVSSFPAIRFAGSLQYLLQYPHGCLEQTTSRLFPLLAFNDLARAVEPELFADASVDYFVEEGIARLERMQMPSGAFTYWPGGSYENPWASIYASHFLVEARRAGYVVSERVYERMVKAMEATARSYRSGDSASLERSAYAVYVLALAGVPDRSTQLYLKNNVLDELPVFSRYQLAGSFALMGDVVMARSLLPQSAAPPVAVRTRETGGNFGSDIRARAVMLDILAEVDPGSPQVPNLVETLSRSAEQGRWYTTQENAYAFLALGKILRSQGKADYSGRLLIDGEEKANFDQQHHRFASSDWGGREITLEIEGSGTGYYYWRADGLPSSMQVEAYDRDLMVRRRYLTDQGRIVDDLTEFRQGDLIITELTLEAPGEDVQNVAVVDMLPAGFEIENPRLQSRRGIDWIADEAYQPDHIDIRDDRLVLYGDLRAGEPVKFYYGIRAVTRGIFVLPPVRAEAMYAPMKASVANSGRIVVNAAEPGDLP